MAPALPSTTCRYAVLVFASRRPQAMTPFCPPKWYQIPQTPYNLKQWDFTQSKPILFQVDGFPGMSMGNALRKTFTALQGRDDLMFQDAGIAISFRLWVRLSSQLYFHLAQGLTNLFSFPAIRSTDRRRCG